MIARLKAEDEAAPGGGRTTAPQGVAARLGGGNSRAPVQSHCIRLENNINDGEYAGEARCAC